MTADVLKLNRTKRIIDGRPAEVNAFPYQVQIRFKGYNGVICGGTILGNSLILTAAHCFEENESWEFPKSLKVVVGTINYNGEGGQTFDVEEYYVPHNYNSDTLDYDISILKVSYRHIIFRS